MTDSEREQVLKKSNIALGAIFELGNYLADIGGGKLVENCVNAYLDIGTVFAKVLNRKES